jgi:hypothetical protein
VNITPKAIREARQLRQSYRVIFSTPDGKRVLTDLIKKYVIRSPAALTSKATLINVGMQKAVLDIVRKVHSTDEEFRQMIEQAHETTNQPGEE